MTNRAQQRLRPHMKLKAARAAVWLGLAAAAASPAADVGIWDRFELVVRNEKRYRDPYADVELRVTYTAPGGRNVHFWGFYDGGEAWRIRFMPDEYGEWRYAAEFSDGTPAAAGSFRCVSSDLPGMISAHEPNPFWFGYRRGGPELLRSFHVGDRFFAANWPDEKRRAFLDWLTANGYNMLSVASHYLNRNAEGRGRGWQTPKLWPLDAGEFRRMEAILDDLARRRILVFPFAGFFGQDSDYPRDPVGQLRYVKYTLARLGPYWNLLFNVAGPEPNLRNRTWMKSPDVVRLGSLIQRLDVFGHLLSVHNRTGDDPYVASRWTSYGILQGPKTVDRRRLSAGLLRNHHRAKPLYAQETLWAGNKFHREPYTATDLRKNAYVIIFSGAAINFGDMDGDSSSGFSGTMELGDRVQERHDTLRHIWDFFETIPYYEMTPRPELVDRGYCLAAPGRSYLVYLDEPGLVNVAVAEAEYKVRWINAQRTSDVRPGGITANGRDLRPPVGGDDWLLYLTVNKPPGIE